MRRSILLAALWIGPATGATAATLHAGPGQQYALPSQAIAAARDGDTVAIHPGQYFDCAVVRRNDLTIEGVGGAVVLTDKPCQGKALLVIDGHNVTIRNLTLQRVRVPDHNGAGIRAEGGDLTVEDTRFVNNQNGLLAASNQAATIRVTGSTFIGNGVCAGSCAHGIYVNQIKLLDVERSRFLGTREGHHIKSRALSTRIVGCDIEDGPDGTASYLIDIPNGGNAVIAGNRLEKGPRSQNPATVIMVGAEGVSQPTERLVFRDNTLVNDEGRPTTFVHNVTATPAELQGNTFRGGVVRPFEGDGSSG
ncbi:MAG: right-handed parallel beta-helix repeat-containing protein [Acetobacteraceae bacterium]|nr:right-handed parallel beta-helix repeat-containing protein [Acetobacteraceae bacterium]